MKKSAKFFGFKTLSLFVFFCFSVISGVGLGTEPAHAATYDPNAEYKISNQLSQRVLDVTNSSNDNGANIQQWVYLSGDNQKWNIQPTGDGYYKIVSKKSGKVLDVQGFSTANGGNVQQWDYLEQDNQKWSIEDVGNGYSKIINKNSGKALDVQGYSCWDGGNIQQWDYLDHVNQRFKIERVSHDQPNAANSLSNGQSLYQGQSLTSNNGLFTLIMQNDGNLVLYKQGSGIWDSNTDGATYKLYDPISGRTITYYPNRFDLSGGTLTQFPYIRDGRDYFTKFWEMDVRGWSTQTYGTFDGSMMGDILIVQDDGNLVYYDTNSGNGWRPVWASNTGGR